MKVLIIDDAFELLVTKFEAAGLEVIPTGPSNSAIEGITNIAMHRKEIDLILLDMELKTELEAGAKIAGILDDETKSKVIAITGEPMGKKVFRNMGILHTPGKRITDVMNCITGNCKCEEAKSGSDFLATSKCDVLITGSSLPWISSIEKVLSVTMVQIKVTSCVGAKDSIKAIQELRPRLVISQGSEISCAEHDYSHMQTADDSLPPLETQYGKIVIVGNNEDQARANTLGQDFISQMSPSLIADLVNKINESLQSEERFLELEIKAKPAFMSNKREELLNIARRMSPSSAANAAEVETKNEKEVQACRWLAVLRREFGPEKLEEVIARN